MLWNIVRPLVPREYCKLHSGRPPRLQLERAPTTKPTKAPTRAPTTKPTMGLTKAPLKGPSNASVKVPPTIDAPKGPVVPVPAPRSAPIKTPTGSKPNTALNRCGLLGIVRLTSPTLRQSIVVSKASQETHLMLKQVLEGVQSHRILKTRTIHHCGTNLDRELPCTSDCSYSPRRCPTVCSAPRMH
jgi:hypothetical protein